MFLQCTSINDTSFFFIYTTKDNLSLTKNINLAVINIISIIMYFFHIDTLYRHVLTISV